MKNVVTQKRWTGFAYAVMAGWLFSTATFGGDKNLLVLFTGAALFIHQSYQEFKAAEWLRQQGRQL